MLARHAVRQFDSEKAGPATFTVARISTTQTYTPFSPQNLALSRAHPVSPSPLVLALVVPVCGQEAPRGGTVKNPRRSLTVASDASGSSALARERSHRCKFDS